MSRKPAPSKASDAAPQPAAYDIFICHSNIDAEAARTITESLEQRGMRCWIAPRDILPGSDWGEAILAGLGACKVLLLVFSEHANKSRQVVREVERAVNLGLAIVPVRIENRLPEKSLEYFISTSHWLDAYASNLKDYIPYVVETVEVLVKRRDGAVLPKAPPPPVRLWLQRRFQLICAAVGLLLIPLVYLSTRPETFDHIFAGKWQNVEPGKKVDWEISADGSFGRHTVFREAGTLSRDGSSYVLNSDIEGERYIPWNQNSAESVDSCLFPNRLWAVITSLGVLPGPRDPSEEISALRDGCLWQESSSGGDPAVNRWTYSHTILGQTWSFELAIGPGGKYELTGKYDDQGKLSALNNEWQLFKSGQPLLGGPYQKLNKGSIVVTNGIVKEVWKRAE